MRKLLILTACVGVLALNQRVDAQSTTPDRNLMFNPTSVRQAPNPQVAKPQPVKPKTKAQADAPKRAKTAPVPSNVATTRSTPPQVTPRDPLPPPTLGRIPFETGSLGVATNKSYSTTVFSDGRVTPGFENVQTKDPTYFGFSLSVPTTNKSIFPLPLLSRPD